MKNQVYTGTPTSRRFALCPSTVVAGDAVLVGDQPAFALNAYSSLTGGATFCFNGTYTATVVGAAYLSPPVSAAINPGDKLAAVGTLDATTNVTTGLRIFKGISGTEGTPFGCLDPNGTVITSGATDTAAMVRI